MRFQKVVALLLVFVLTIALLPRDALAQTDKLGILPDLGNLETLPYQNELTADDIVREVESLRTADTKHFLMKDGSYIAVQFDSVIHYQDSRGKWADIDNRLTTEKTSKLDIRNYINELTPQTPEQIGAFVRERGNVDIQLAQTANPNSGLLFTGYKGYSVAFSLKGAKQTTMREVPVPKIDKSNSIASAAEPAHLTATALYADILDGVDLEYTLYGENIKENIIVKRPMPSYEFSFDLILGNLIPAAQEDGSILLNDPLTDKSIYVIPAPYMIDANGVFSQEARYTLTGADSVWILTVTADSGWMNAADRAFPVTVDPMISFQGTGTDNGTIKIASINNTQSPVMNANPLYIGGDTGGTRYRVYVKANGLETLVPKNSILVYAELQMATVTSPQGYSALNMPKLHLSAHALNSDTWTWNTSYNAKTIDYATVSENTQGQWISWNLTSVAKQWYDGTAANNGIVLKAINESSMTSSAAANARFYNTSANPPKFIVHYRSAVGLEDYYTYHAQDIGRAGTGYVMDYTGFMTLVKNDLSNASTVLPYTLQHIYNSAAYNKTTTSSYPGMYVGAGWKLNAQQSLVSASGNQLIYVDGDGTEHWFTKAGSEYLDEDGLGLKVTEPGNSTRVMTDPKGNKMIFNSTNGQLTSLEDANGNKILFTITGNKITKITSQTNGASAVTVAELTYATSGHLTSVKDRAGNVTEYVFATGFLTAVKHPDGTVARYQYENNGTGRLTGAFDEEAARSYGYAYTTRGLVWLYEEYGKSSAAGERVEITRPAVGRTEFAYPRKNNIKEISLFDSFGRTAATYVTDANKTTILGADNVRYTANTSTSKLNNRVTEGVAMGAAAVSMIQNGGFELNTAWTIQSGTITKSSNSKRTGNYGIEVANASSEATYRHSASVTLEKGKPYTLSAYVNTSGTTFQTGGGVYVKFATANSGSVDGELFNIKTTSTVTGGWHRISCTFVPGATASYMPAISFKNYSGTVYADDIQLEQAEAPGSYNLAYYGNMENGGWTTSGGTTQYDTSVRQSGAKSLKIVGNPDEAIHPYADFQIKLPGKETYIVSGWAKAESVAITAGRTFGIRAEVVYDGGGVDTFYESFHPDVTEWQFISFPVVPKQPSKTVSYIRLTCFYNPNMNTAYFDNVSLTRELVQTYSYDTAGNLTKVGTSDKDDQTYTYQGANLTQMVGGDGTYTYEYDSKNNMVKAKNGNLAMSIVYNGAGNATSSKLAASSGGVTLNSGASYSTDGNRVASVTNPAGQTVSYDYGAANTIYQMAGLPLKVTSPNGLAVNNKYLTNNGRLESSYISGAVGIFPTYSNGILSVLTRKGPYNGSTLEQSYNYSYDSFGNLAGVSVGVPGSTQKKLVSYEYAANNGNLNKMTYGNNHYLANSYDVLDRVKSVVYSGFSTSVPRITFSYTGDGQLYSMRDAALGLQYIYDYDSTGRPINSYTKDNDGNLLLSTATQYDAKGRMNQLHYVTAGFSNPRTTVYTYDNVSGNLTTLRTSDAKDHAYTYDHLLRLTKRQSHTYYNVNYTYRNVNTTNTTTQVSALTYRKGTTSTNWLDFQYTYDNMGNIETVVDPRGYKTTYTYDQQGQLLKERVTNGSALVYEYSYTTDGMGNIRSKKYTPGSGTAQTINYGYTDSQWTDLLTSYNGQTITYDAIGNPLSYRGMTLAWQNGRELKSAAAGGKTVSYAYDANGLRVSKTSNNNTLQFIYLDGKLVAQKYDNDTVNKEKSAFIYDESGHPYRWEYMNAQGTYTPYFYITNLQGDVVQITDASCNVKVEYVYNAYGEIVDIIGDQTLAAQNPLRYRGYYYDNETGLYYLNSRYYDPAVGRFINADATDALTVEHENFVQYNLFAYCWNNPVNLTDDGGTWPSWLKKIVAAVAVVAVVAVAAAVTVATAGAGTAVAVIAVGAAKGAAIGAASGAAIGAATGAVKHRVQTGSWKGAGKAALEAGASGALSGAITGAVMGGISSGVNYVKANGVKVHQVGRLKPSNKSGNGNLGVKYQINKANGKPTIKSFEFHANHAHKGYQPHWQQNTWNPYNNSISSGAKHWSLFGRRI